MCIFSLCVCAVLGAMWQEKLQITGNYILLRGDVNGEGRVTRTRSRIPADGQTFQRIEQNRGTVFAEYGFVNFNNDPLRVAFSIPLAELAAYKREYGYTEADLSALKQWQKKALDDALQYAKQNRLKQEELNRMGEKINRDYKAKHLGLLQSRGFSALPGNVYVADIPSIARRNVKKVRPVSLQLSSQADKLGYGSDEIISAALSLVQTALRYEVVPMYVDGRQAGGVFPPLETLTRGKGDCDTKTALLASILLNWDRISLVGVNVPNHYLMGVLRNPAKGDLFVEYNGLRYVLIEPAGPAWLPPGTVGTETRALLKAGSGLRIEPITAN